ncbi:MAG TPA: SOS response-associated peptidase family protein [Noviherbaspirillum sp.]
MCTNYRPSAREVFASEFETFHDRIDGLEWKDETYRDYLAPIIVAGEGGRREAVLAGFGFTPKRHLPPGVEFSTMNARGEEIGGKKTYKQAWKDGQLCLVPMQWFYEPNWESGVHVRTAIGMADGRDFCVAGVWREWKEEDGSTSNAFAQITVNADEHELMKHFHKPGDEKRSLVIVPREGYDDWLQCKNPEVARAFMQLYPAELMKSWAAPKPAAPKKEKPQQGLL